MPSEKGKNKKPDIRGINGMTEYIVPLSAKNADILRQIERDLLSWLKQDNGKTDLQDIAYTLGVCRNHFDKRSAFIAGSCVELIRDLEKKVDGRQPADENFQKKASGIAQDILINYLSGGSVDWRELYSGTDGRKISLPTYPFLKNRYWLDEQRNGAVEKGLHPLIDVNSSTIYSEVFEKTFTGREFFLKDHIVGDRMVLPGVAYLEMARAAGVFASGGKKIGGLSDVYWAIPFEMKKNSPAKTAFIELEPEDGGLRYRFAEKDGEGDKINHAGGTIFFADGTPAEERIDIVKIKKAGVKHVKGTDCYQAFHQNGLFLQRSFQAIQELWSDGRQMLSRLSLPAHLRRGYGKYGLHPSLIDGALETVIGFVMDGGSLSLPCAMDRLDICRSVNPDGYAYVTENKGAKQGLRKFDVKITDLDGNVEVVISGAAFKEMGEADTPAKEVLYFRKTEEESESPELPQKREPVLLLGGEGTIYTELKSLLAEKLILAVPGDTFGKEGNGRFKLRMDSEEDFSKLFNEISDGTDGVNIINAWPVISEGAEPDKLFNAMLAMTKAAFKTVASGEIRCTSVYRSRESSSPSGNALVAFCKSVSIENARLHYKTVAADSPEDFMMAGILLSEVYSKEIGEIVYRAGKRYAVTPREIQSAELSGEFAPREGGTYIVTGGTGSLGMLFADFLSRKTRVNLVLASRSGSVPERNRKLFEKITDRSQASVIKADVTSKADVDSLVREVKSRFGRIHGVIHCAGVSEDAPIAKKTAESAARVLSPKIRGAAYLDRVLADEELDFFVMISSIAAVTGNAGQCDYAFANGFIDGYAGYREELVRQGKRKGRTVSIGFSLWNTAGMHVDGSTRELFAQTMGVYPLETEDGLESFARVAGSGFSNVAVINGVRGKVEKTLGIANTRNHGGFDGDEKKRVFEKVRAYVAEKICIILKVNSQDIDYDKKMGKYGFNSLTYVDLANAINSDIKSDITPAIFFECSTIGELSDYITRTYGREAMDYLRKDGENPGAARDLDQTAKAVDSAGAVRFSAGIKETASVNSDEPIAIIGVSGVMPQSDDLNEFWQHLVAQDDLITEVPKNRWDIQRYEGKPAPGSGKPVSKWGGFMKEPCAFDAPFFGISPREAQLMDPQQRLFLQTVYNTLEDAGYARESLSGTKTGLYAGVATDDYNTLQIQNGGGIEAYSATGSSHAILVNRVSFLFDWYGPSVPVDTACSSSLVAIHLAVEGLRSGDCDYAVAGGVNVILAPTLNEAFSSAGMLSEDGRCKTFDKKADGYVRGEGCGAILLKPLKKAEADGDHIYAVIKGSAVNHGGHANSLTAPNPKAQADVITRAYRRAGFDPDTVTCIEAHGTGTNIGDPVEINGLKLAFESLYSDTGRKMPASHHCHIKTVKTNIGHLEAAAGIAGVLSLLLGMKYGKIPGNAHLHELNPYIDIKATPFDIPGETIDWTRIGDGKGSWVPRRAGVSSFGFGGANVHIALEEYIRKTVDKAEDHAGAQVIVFSAITEDRLPIMAERLAQWLKTDDGMAARLCDIAYTLQTGRDLFDERLVVIAGDKEELAAKLAAFAKGKLETGVFTGDGTGLFSVSKIPGTPDALAAAYLSEGKADFSALYNGVSPKRIPLPVYPFEKEVFWFDINKGSGENKASTMNTALHPLVEQNVSTLNRILFRKKLLKKEFFLRDHVVEGMNILPGVAYLEMLRAAGQLGGIDPVGSITDVSWIQPIVMDGPEQEILISLTPEKDGAQAQVYGMRDGEKSVYCEAKLHPVSTDTILPRRFDIEELKSNCTKTLDRQYCYNTLYKRCSFDYGPAFQVTDRLAAGEDTVVAELTLPEELEQDADRFVLHPSLLDGSIRIIAGLEDESQITPHLPFSIGKMEIFAPIPKKCYSYGTIVPGTENRDSGSMQFNVSVLDGNGTEVVRISGLMVRPYKQVGNALSCYEPVWKAVKIPDPDMEKGDLLLFGNDSVLSEISVRYQEQMQESRIFYATAADRFLNDGSGRYTVNIGNQADFDQLFQSLKNQNVNALNIIWQPDLKSVQKTSSVGRGSAEWLDSMLERTYYPLARMFKALATGAWQGRVKCLFAFSAVQGEEKVFLNALSALSGSVASLNPEFGLKILQLPSDTTGLSEILVGELLAHWHKNGLSVKYVGGRMSRTVREIQVSAKRELLRNGGTYILTGGAGGMGMTIAAAIAERYGANLVLTGRGNIDETTEKKLALLRAKGAAAVYIKADVTSRTDMRRAADETKRRFGSIQGILHFAGILGEKPLFDATKKDLEKVLLAKAGGAVNLDETLKNEDLEAFILISSISALIGDTGACSYGIANRLLDEFAVYRTELASKGLRKGETIAIDWPLWANGGMEMPQEQRALYTAYTGMKPVSNKDGAEAFFSALALGAREVIPAWGAKYRIEAALGVEDEQAADETAAKPLDAGPLQKAAEEYLRGVLSGVVKIPPQKIKPEAAFERYGIDSIMIIELNKLLGKSFGNIPKTLFFEHKNLRSLACYFTAEKSAELTAALKESGIALPVPAKAAGMLPAATASIRSSVYGETAASGETGRDGDIAIIGISGRYPMAENLQEFWENLKSGRDCITEVPKDRWDHSKYFDPDTKKENTVYGKWGGFIDVDKFDPLFFHILPKDAALLDPQERLFLENVYSTLENAGYSKQRISGTATGVFAGVTNALYHLHGAEELVKGHLLSLNSTLSSVANQVSYFFNLTGPSMAVDTMCSSSLTAIHLACESLKRGECTMAIAGGVNALTHIDRYIFMSQQHFASADGRCRSFGDGGTGYVPSEGVGSVLLKPLKHAVRDKDYIYAVIKATAVNHGGKTNGYTVPNPNAQGELITQTLQKAEVDPRTISYLEAHGTGTALGDPIEISGLMQAYGKWTKDRQFCRIGSVKSNIGHAESAAGIAGLTKIVLQMKHKKLVPSIHSDKLNENIDFGQTPFKVQHAYEDWTAPEDGTERRRAGLSSFGAGGSNVHVIVEEYPETARNPDDGNGDEKPQLFVLSARTRERLHAYCSELLDYLSGSPAGSGAGKTEKILPKLTETVARLFGISAEDVGADASLDEFGFDDYAVTALSEAVNQKFGVKLTSGDVIRCGGIRAIAELITERLPQESFSLTGANVRPTERFSDILYTLQEREQLYGARLAVISSNRRELCDQLSAYLDGRTGTNGIYVNREKLFDAYGDDEGGTEKMKNAEDAGDLIRVAELWVSGINLDADRLYQGGTQRRIPLPAYPFEKVHCWYEKNDDRRKATESISPVIDENISTMESQKFRKTLTPQDFYIQEHGIRGKMILPGAAYLEMAYSGACLISETKKTCGLRDVVWLKPFVLDTPAKDIFIKYFEGKFGIEFEIYSKEDGADEVHAKGRVNFEEPGQAEPPESVDTGALIKNSLDKTEADEIYERFDAAGLEYGTGFRSIKTAYRLKDGILAEIRLADGYDKRGFNLNPALLDASLQSAALSYAMDGGSGLNLPFALGRITVFGKLPGTCFAYVTKENGSDKRRITITNGGGTVLARLEGFLGRPAEQPGAPSQPREETDGGQLLDLLKSLEKGRISISEAEQRMEEI